MDKRKLMDRARRVLAWLIAIVLAIGYLKTGFDKLVLAENIRQQFEAFGYSLGFARLIGVLEGIGALLLLVPRFAAYGAAGIGVVMLGAIYTHLSTEVGYPYHAMRNLAFFLILIVLRWRDTYRFMSGSKKQPDTGISAVS